MSKIIRALAGALCGLVLAYPLPTVAAVTAVWVADPGDKILQDDITPHHTPCDTRHRVWCDDAVHLSAAGNETVSFVIVVDADSQGAKITSVRLDTLRDTQNSQTKLTAGSSCSSADCHELYDWTGRDIELFKVGYVQVRGVDSHIVCEDERSPLSRRKDLASSNIFVPGCSQPRDASDNTPTAKWAERTVADRFVPDILAPIERYPGGIDVGPGHSQEIWVDITMPKGLGARTFQGKVQIEIDGKPMPAIPVELKTRAFDLDDFPFQDISHGYGKVRPMAYVETSLVLDRYLGLGHQCGDDMTPTSASARMIVNRHFLLAQRHRLQLFTDTDDGCRAATDPFAMTPRLDGSLFTAQMGYRGAGMGSGNGLYVIDAYAQLINAKQFTYRFNHPSGFKLQDIVDKVDSEYKWIKSNFIDKGKFVDSFVYLCDEVQCRCNQPDCSCKEETTCLPDADFKSFISALTRFRSLPGGDTPTFATLEFPETFIAGPVLPERIMLPGVAESPEGRAAMKQLIDAGRYRIGIYNPQRPFAGSFQTEDSASAPREMMWAAADKAIDDVFFWNTTYYCDSQKRPPCPPGGLTGINHLYQDANTFGLGIAVADGAPENYGASVANGNGVLFYPGADMVLPHENDFDDFPGPIASIRLKAWRRGSEDLAYLRAYMQAHPQEAPGTIKNLKEALIQMSFWDFEAQQIDSRNWVDGQTCWSDDPLDWEDARAYLGDLIEAKSIGQPKLSGFSCWKHESKPLPPK